MAASILELLSPSNPVFAAYVFYSAILVGKMLLMSFLTARLRFKNKVFISPEDTPTIKGSKVKYDNPDIERVRRAHLNDLENIPVFFIIALLYITTDPTHFIALNLIRLFAVARIVHTLVYAVVVIPQPARALAWGVSYFINWFMVIQTVMTYL